MKTLRHLVKYVFVLLTIGAVAQQGINYKALIKDSGGNVVANQNVTVQFIIYEGAALTNNVYQETHNPMTDSNGIVIVNIGEGTTSDDFSTIDWGADDHFLNVQIDTGGGLTDMVTIQFMAVPYALSSLKVNSETMGIDDLSDGKSDSDGTNDASSLFLGLDAGLSDNSSDNRNVGVGYRALFSNTTGNNNTAAGYRALLSNSTAGMNTAFGSFALTNTTLGELNTAIGSSALFNNTEGDSNTVSGYGVLYNNTLGIENTAMGAVAGFNATGSGNIFLGFASGSNETGNNKLYIENSDADAENALIYGEFDNNILRSNGQFQIGNPSGTGFSFPTTDGSADQLLQTDGNGSLSWNDAVTPTGLEIMNEGNGDGWRLIGRDPANYGNIGENAVDFSNNDVASSAYGATGDNSIAMGYQATASNGWSIAIGREAMASNYYSVALGPHSESSGYNSTTLGWGTKALGDNSTAIGFGSEASGNTSTAMGYNSIASGDYSTAMGNYTKAESSYSTAIGRSNIGGGNPIGWQGIDPLFEIGNGTDDLNRTNALTVLKNGLITAPTLTTAMIDAEGTGKALITKEYAGQLVALDEGNGDGYRLRGADPANYGAIGLNAVDLSNSVGASSTYGATGNNSVTMGYRTTASGDYSISIGSNTSAESRSSIAIGSYNLGGGTPDSWVSTEPIFEVGIGTSFMHHANALTVLKNGTVTAPEFSIAEIDLVGNPALITKEYADTNYDSSGLEALNEGNGFGWRLIGRNPDNYGNIGSNAVDLSYSLANSTKGATGSNSVAMGYETIASGNGSMAMGVYSLASGLESTAMGEVTTASGWVSTAMGAGTKAESFISTAIGRFNTGGGTADSWVSTDPLFEIGNGDSDVSLSNALTVLKNGTITAPALTNTLINTAGNKALITKEYADTNYNPTGLEALDEGSGGSGWRLIGRNPDNYGNIGVQSVDLSYSNAASLTNGATGTRSIALGYFTTASATYSTAMGSGTIASGTNSTAMGRFTKAESYASTAIGYYNLGGGTAGSWVATDPLFEIGNGTDDVSRANAFMVLKNGDVYSNGVLRHSSDRRLKTEITKLDYGLADILKLNPVSYYWKEDRDSQNHKSIGLIAQDVQPILEELVQEGHDKDKLLSLNYEGLIPVLINAIKEQNEIIEKQKNENIQQGKSIENLIKRVEQLESSMNQ